ncbi:uncharacterized protein LOC128264582 [Drosophila gunungcola]|uniref:Ubiquitin-like protease family profile domain-containing protein n=1 Tax=Drosophila gunungcola TaxID=103775 RepID=A0A9P9YCV6_9MUSC|nr:uncharacterized protein LOC128264582 [Drosophila gunungcola]XP_052856099.1 uncharacterized protein LOC128264582 [Drosophila gunungcola]KAI8034380.1 hypothetical protein M5D96_012843 [Drosophila gunungcola]
MCARIMKRRRAISAAEDQEHAGEEVAQRPQQPQQQYADSRFTRNPAVRRISLNDYMVMSRQLQINRIGQNNQNKGVAKMLVLKENGPQKIITMTLPSVSFTVQDILQQVGYEFDENTTIDCLENPSGNIHVVVSVGFTMTATAAEMAAHADEISREQQAATSRVEKPEEPPTDRMDAHCQAASNQSQVPGVGTAGKRLQLEENNSTTGGRPEASPKNPKSSTPPKKLSHSSDSKSKPATQAVQFLSAVSCSSSRAPISISEMAEQRRLRRDRRYLPSRYFDDDDDDDDNDEDEDGVVLLSSDEDEETNIDERQTERNAADAERLKLMEETSQDKKPRQLSADEDLTLLIYPPKGTGGLCITMKDYVCLSSGNYLNDIIIDFYLLWLKNTVIPEAQRDRTHIFSTFFHKRLTTLTRPMNMKQTAAQKRHERVQKWTRTVDIFDKDFIIIPFNHQAHWILAIICFPSLRGSVPYDGHGDGGGGGGGKGKDEDLTDDKPVKQPVILIFDSLAGTSRNRVIAILRDYLTCEYQAKKPNAQAHIFNKDNMPGHRVEVPQQENLTDCGLYLLQYVEQFFTKPIRDYRLPIKELSNWFDLLTVTKKREDIANLIQRLMDEGNQQQQQQQQQRRRILPVIKFPTLNGQMVKD